VIQHPPKELLPPAAADCTAAKIDTETRVRDEDHNLSTEAGQLHKSFLTHIARTSKHSEGWVRY